MILRKLLPFPLRLRLKLILRFCKDLASGTYFRLAYKKQPSIQGPHSIQIQQTIMKSYLFENKLHNIKHGAQKINNITIAPNEVFSFWHTVGAATEQNGFKKGRNIVNGVLSEEIGGGLCQLGSITYHLALECGLEMLERYNHSIDIYKEEERYTPLGADAAIVYGYKDVRFRNNQDATLQLSFSFKENHITATCLSTKALDKQEIRFSREYSNKSVTVTGKNKEGNICNNSYYLLP